MNLQEFKAWFDGFTENLEAAPSAKQWKRVKEQVAKIDGAPITYPVYIDRYVRPWHPYYGALGVAQNTYSADAIGAQSYNLALADQSAGFDGVQAMYAAGRMEAGNA